MTESVEMGARVSSNDSEQKSPAEQTEVSSPFRSSNSPPVVNPAAGISPPCSSNSLSSTTIGDLPDSALTDFLIRLPAAKSATICKSVSKHWLSTISNSHFIHCFVGRHSTVPRPCSALIYGEKLTRTHVVPVHSDPLLNPRDYLPFGRIKQPTMQVLASCNDLLLCSPTFTNHVAYFICNPFTMQVVDLPPLPPPRPGLIDNLFGLICEPYNSRKSHEVFSINSYKVICFHNQTKHLFRASMFSSETGKWCTTEIAISPILPLLIDFDMPIVCCNGMLYWWTNSIGIGGPLLASCSANEPRSFSVINPPADYESWNRWPICRNEKFRIGVYRGRILVFKLIFQDQIMLCVWESIDFAKSEWRTVHRVNLSEISFEEDYLYEMVIKGQVWLVSLHPEDEDIVHLGFTTKACSSNLGSSDQLFSFNIRERKLMRVAGPLPNISNSVFHDSFPIPLPSWPTPIPKYSELVEERIIVSVLIYPGKILHSIRFDIQGLWFSSL